MAGNGPKALRHLDQSGHVACQCDLNEVGPCIQKLSGKNELDRMGPHENNPFSRQKLLAFQQRLYRVCGHHTGQCPAGERDRHVIGPSGQQETPRCDPLPADRGTDGNIKSGMLRSVSVAQHTKDGRLKWVLIPG